MIPHVRPVVLLCAAILLTPAGCKKELPDPASPAPPLANAGPPPTEEEAQQFADRMTRAVRARDAVAMDKLLRLSDLTERIISDLDLSDQFRQGIRKGMTQSMRQASLGQQVLQSIQDDGSYQLLRIRTVDGRPRPLFRLIGSEGALNYHDYYLARYEDGEVATEDMFVFASGEPISQSMRRLLIPAVASLRGKGLFGKLDPQELDSMKTIRSMAKAIRARNYKSAIAAYRTLPRTFQERKPVLILYIQATMNLETDGDAEYLAALEVFRKLYPRDAALDFISIDYFFLKKRYDEACRAMDRINKAVGGDPYLDVLRGSALLEAGRFKEARQAIEKAIKDEPNLVQAYWFRIGLSLREKKYADTLAWLQRIVEKCHVDIQDLTGVPDYAGFVASPQYTMWQKWNAGRAKGKDQPEKKKPPARPEDDQERVQK